MSESTVVYHKNCNDGAMAAAIFKTYSTIPIGEYVAANYQEDINLDKYAGKDVYLLDFSFTPRVMKEVLEVADSVTVIDHHKDPVESLKLFQEANPNITENLNLEYCDISISGAEATWKYFFNRNPPLSVSLIGDRDTWKFELEATKAFTAGIGLMTPTIETMQQLLLSPSTVHDHVADGNLILRYNRTIYESIYASSNRLLEIGGHLVPVCNAHGRFASDLCEYMYTLHPQAKFVATYYDCGDFRKFSLRNSVDNLFDTAAVSRLYGGKGHVHASGFSVPRHHHLARV